MTNKIASAWPEASLRGSLRPINQLKAFCTKVVRSIFNVLKCHQIRRVCILCLLYSMRVVHSNELQFHDDVIEWKHFSRYWPFVWAIHRSLVNSPHKGQWRGALFIFFICAWINDWVNNGEAGDLRRHHAPFDVTVILLTRQETDASLSQSNKSWRFDTLRLGKWPPFCKQHFQFCLIEIGVYLFNFQWKLCPFNNMPTLFQIMAWCRYGDKPLCEPMMALFTDANMRHSVSMY